MLHSPPDKIGQILHNYNITSVKSDPTLQSYKMTLHNLQSGINVQLDSNMPLYNVVYTKQLKYNPVVPTLIYDEPLISTKTMCFEIPKTAIKLSLFNIDANGETLVSNYIETENQKRYRTFDHGNNKQSSEYFSYFSLTDINNIIDVSAITNITVNSVYGKFFKDNNNNIRLIFNPKSVIIENVDTIYFSDFNVFYTNGYSYAIYYIIYTTIDDTTNIKLKYFNSFVDSLTSKGKCDISLSSIFNTNQPTLNIDIANISQLNSKFFIINSLFNFGIYLNTPSGIVRYIPYTFTKQFFNIIFNNMFIKLDYYFKYYCGSGEKSLNNTVFKPPTEYVSTMNIDIQTNSILPLINNSKIVEQESYNDISNFKDLLKLTSTAELFNDMIFSLSNNTESFNVPIFIVNELVI